MTERSRRILYRLYGLAECTYFFMTDALERLEKEFADSKRSVDYLEMERKLIKDKSIIVQEEPEDNDGDEWTMFEKDYKAIREVMEVYDDNTD